MATLKNRSVLTLLEVVAILGIVAAFYLPTLWLQPDEPHRWSVWMFGYLGGLAVSIFQRSRLG